MSRENALRFLEKHAMSAERIEPLAEARRMVEAMEAFASAANGQATKIIIPSEIQSVAGLAAGLLESVKEEK